MIHYEDGPCDTEWWACIMYIAIWQHIFWHIGFQTLLEKHNILVTLEAQKTLSVALQQMYGPHMPYIRMANCCMSDLILCADLTNRYLR